MGNRTSENPKVNSKNWRSIIAVSAALLLVAICVMVTGGGTETVYSVDDYEVSALDMRIAVSKDHTCEVEEFISVDIPEDLQMIEFAVPDGSFRIQELTLEGEKAKAVRRSSGKHVVIRDPQLLTAGHHRYRITYRLLEGPDSSKEKDTFSFDIIPAGWKQPVYKVHALMWFPYGFPLEDIRIYADESPGIKQTIKIEPQSRSYTLGLRGVPEDHSVRVEADLPDGYWE